MFNLIPWRKERDSTRALERKEHPLSLFREEFDNLFDRFFSRWSDPFALDLWTGPAGWGFDLEEKDNEVVVRCEAPGFEADDFDINVRGNALTVRAERKEESGEKKNGYAYSQRRLQRTFTLPANANPEQIEARYRNGVLELHIAKNPEAQGKRIKVHAS